MSIADLKLRLADVPGIETLSLTLIGGRSCYGFAGKIAAVDPLASDQEIEDAIRNAARLPSIAMIPDKPKEAPMTVTGAGYAAGSLSSKLRAIRDKISAGSSKMDAALEKMDQAAEAHNSLADTVAGEADALLAELGQFTNGAPK